MTAAHADMARRSVDVRALREWNLRNLIARSAYEDVKADHALPFGCDVCCKGAASLPKPGGVVIGAGVVCKRCKTNMTGQRLIVEAMATQPPARARDLRDGVRR